MTAFGPKIAIHQPKITIFRSKITKNGQVSNKIYLFIIITVIFNYYRPLEHILDRQLEKPPKFSIFDRCVGP